jgi:hypothetical protein
VEAVGSMLRRYYGCGRATTCEPRGFSRCTGARRRQPSKWRGFARTAALRVGGSNGFQGSSRVPPGSTGSTGSSGSLTRVLSSSTLAVHIARETRFRARELRRAVWRRRISHAVPPSGESSGKFRWSSSLFGSFRGSGRTDITEEKHSCRSGRINLMCAGVTRSTASAHE